MRARYFQGFAAKMPFITPGEGTQNRERK